MTALVGFAFLGLAAYLMYKVFYHNFGDPKRYHAPAARKR